MGMRRILAATAAAVMVAGGVSLAAAPAASADQTLTIDCSTSDTTQDVVLAPGETLTVDGSNCAYFTSEGSVTNVTTSNFCYDGTWGPGTSISCRPDSTPTVSVTVGDPVPLGVLFALSVNDFGRTVTFYSVAPAPAAAANPIPAWVQAYGRFGKDATCLDGWDASWQSWALPATGGWVCTRSIPSLG